MRTDLIAAEIEKWNRYYASIPEERADAPEPAAEAFHAELAACIAELLPDGGRVLEAGCGAGRQSLALARLGRYQVGLLDFSAEALRHARNLFAREGLPAEFHAQGLQEPGEPSFDLVFNAGVLEHYSLADQTALLRGMATRSRRYVLAIVPNRLCYWYWPWRLQLTARGRWPFGRETPAVDLSHAFTQGGLHFVGHRFMGTEWAEDFLREVEGIEEKTRERLIAAHRDGSVPLSERAYLIAGLGEIPSREGARPQGWFTWPAPASASSRATEAGGPEPKPVDVESFESISQQLQDALQGIVRLRRSRAFRIAAVVNRVLSAGLGPKLDSVDVVPELLRRCVLRVATAAGTSAAPAVALQTDGGALAPPAGRSAGSRAHPPDPPSLRPRSDPRHKPLALPLAITRAGRTIARHQLRANAARIGKLGWLAGRELQRFQHGITLRQILRQHPDRPIAVFPPLVDWNIPIYQRPQHIALQLAQAGHLYFFCTPNIKFDSVDGFRELAPGCYITNQYDELVRLKQRKLFHLYSTDLVCAGPHGRSLECLERQLAAGNRVLYEYIDEIHPDISLQIIPDSVWRRHQGILDDERIPVVATATRLYEQVRQHRTRNCALVTNGVDVAHFASARRTIPPAELAPIVARGRPIVGYFGALAGWFEYELLARLARERDCEIVLIGYDYPDGSAKHAGLERIANIHRVGPVPYADLPRYACWFDVSTIPFRINEVTESTSPIKLFEYMALGTPIVTTDMPECRKYASVLIGRTPEEFIGKVDEALALRGNQAYLSVLRAEALANTWEQKATAITDLLRDGERSPHETRGF